MNIYKSIIGMVKTNVINQNREYLIHVKKNLSCEEIELFRKSLASSKIKGTILVIDADVDVYEVK